MVLIEELESALDEVELKPGEVGLQCFTARSPAFEEQAISEFLGTEESRSNKFSVAASFATPPLITQMLGVASTG